MTRRIHDERSIVDGFFDAALDPDLWERSLTALSDYVGGSSINLIVVDRLGERPVAERFVRGNEDAYASYLADYFTIDRRVPRVVEAKPNSILLEHQVLSADEKRVDVVYNEILAANGMRNLALCNLTADGQFMGLGIAPRNDALPFETGQTEALARVLPDLRHALRFFNLNRDLQVQRSSLGDLWGHAGKGLAILDSSGKVIFANALLEEQIKAGLCSIRQGVVRFADPRSEMEWREKKGSLRASNGTLAEFLAQNPRNAEQFCVRLIVTPALATPNPMLRAPAFILLVQSLREGLLIGQAEIDRFCQLFGVTPSERLVVGAVASGTPLSVYAAGRGITMDTARKQLKSAMAKCGVASQKALVSRLERFCFLTSIAGPAAVL